MNSQNPGRKCLPRHIGADVPLTKGKRQSVNHALKQANPSRKKKKLGVVLSMVDGGSGEKLYTPPFFCQKGFLRGGGVCIF